MNTLTENRILEEGDQWKTDKGEWRNVPSTEHGLQIMFSKFSGKEIRRPSEEPFVVSTPSPQCTCGDHKIGEPHTCVVHPMVTVEPISPNQDAAKLVQAEAVPDTAEGDTSTPVASHSATGGTPSHDHLAAYLPTVISKKAHEKDIITLEECESIQDEAKRLGVDHPERFAIHQLREMVEQIKADDELPADRDDEPLEGELPVKDIDSLHLRFGPTKYEPTWMGRNGCFKGIGLNMGVLKPDKIIICPVGKRGQGNCHIEFPASAIPEIVDWLKKAQPK